MEPEPIQHVPQEPPIPPKKKRGNPNIAAIGRANGATHVGVMNWERSCMFYVKPYLDKSKWTTGEYGRKLVGILQLIAAKNEKVAKVLAEWNKLEKRNGTFILDKCCDRAEVSRAEFAEILLKAVRGYFRRMAQATVEVELPQMVDASIKFSASTAKEASAERQRHLETQGIIDKAGPRTAISVNQKQVSGVPAKSFDSVMDELDDAIDGEILGETRLIGDGR